MSRTVSPDTRWAWKAVKVTLAARYGFKWPVSGQVKAPGPFVLSNASPCPVAAGDGLCLAKTPAGAASGGYGLLHSVILLVSFDPRDVLCEDGDKVRVRKCRTHGVIDARTHLIRPRANLSWANLTGADLTGARLSRADLSWADLTRARLSRANLSGANLSGANLTGANLTGANLTRAYLTGADLTGADLTGANLTGANLSGANLSRAYLTGAIGTTEKQLSGAVKP